MSNQCGFVMTTEDYERIGVCDENEWRCQRSVYKDGQCFYHVSYQNKDWEDIRSELPHQSEIVEDSSKAYVNEEGGIQFRGVCLDGADFRNFKDNNGSFDDCSLIGAQFVDADLFAHSFNNADLRGADLSDSRLACFFKDVNFREAKLTGSHLVDSTFSASCDNSIAADFRGADLADSNFRLCDLSGLNFEEADLARSDLRDATLTNARLYQALFSDSRINVNTKFGQRCPYETSRTDPEGGDVDPLQAAVWTYRQIERLSRNNALIEQADAYRFRKIEAHRKRQKTGEEPNCLRRIYY